VVYPIAIVCNAGDVYNMAE